MRIELTAGYVDLQLPDQRAEAVFLDGRVGMIIGLVWWRVP